MAMPMLVLHLLGAEAVGFYKAATAISVGYLGFLVTAMGQDYYPRVSAIADDPKALVSLVNDQHRLVMMLAGPLILGTLAIVPYLVPLVYSKQFGPTVEILEWQLIGDLFKFSSWTMSFVILARCRSSILLLTESTVGATTLVCTWLTVRLWGLPALGISFLASYVLYYLVVWILIRREIPFAWNSNNKRMMLAAVGAAFVVRIIPMTGFPELRTAAALCLSLAAGIYGLHGIWRELFRSEKAAVNNTVAQSA
jgi:PST family polysaccharide transporter